MLDSAQDEWTLGAKCLGQGDAITFNIKTFLRAAVESRSTIWAFEIAHTGKYSVGNLVDNFLIIGGRFFDSVCTGATLHFLEIDRLDTEGAGERLSIGR